MLTHLPRIAQLGRLGRLALAAGAVLLAGLTLAVSSAVPAAQAYSSDDEPTLSTASPGPGDDVRVSGAGFQGGSTVTVMIYSTPVELGTAVANAAGEVSVDVEIPASFVPGSTHRIELQGVDPDGDPFVLSRSVTIAGGSSLAQTGATLAPIVVGAGLMLAVGIVLVARGRVRRAPAGQ